MSISSRYFLVFFLLVVSYTNIYAQASLPKFKVIAFYTGKNDQAHVSYVKEALKWFPEAAAKNNFSFDATTNWESMNDAFLANYDVIVFLDTRPEKPQQRAAFQKFMENGGGWLGFHFAAFALTPSAYSQNWDWYHQTFVGSGEYGSNTWRPTSAILKVEDQLHPVMKGLGATFKASPNEWYRWKNDLKANPDIKILLSIDPSSFPLGTGPKPHEIWHEGYYPVVWTNQKYKMLYVNMGHNDIDYEHKVDSTNSTLSLTFDNETQNRMVTNALLWLGNKTKLQGLSPINTGESLQPAVLGPILNDLLKSNDNVISFRTRQIDLSNEKSDYFIFARKGTFLSAYTYLEKKGRLEQLRLPKESLELVWRTFVQNDLFTMLDEKDIPNFCLGKYQIYNSYTYEFVILTRNSNRKLSYYNPEYYDEACYGVAERKKIINSVSIINYVLGR